MQKTALKKTELDMKNPEKERHVLRVNLWRP